MVEEEDKEDSEVEEIEVGTEVLIIKHQVPMIDNRGMMVNQPPQENNSQANDLDPSQIVCYTCSGTGHYQNGCAFRGHGQNPNYRGSGRGGRR